MVPEIVDFVEVLKVIGLVDCYSFTSSAILISIFSNTLPESPGLFWWLFEVRLLLILLVFSNVHQIPILTIQLLHPFLVFLWPIFTLSSFFCLLQVFCFLRWSVTTSDCHSSHSLGFYSYFFGGWVIVQDSGSLLIPKFTARHSFPVLCSFWPSIC